MSHLITMTILPVLPSYVIGQAVDVLFEIRDVAGVLTDDEDLLLTVAFPNGEQTTYDTGDFMHAGDGLYQLSTLILESAGGWRLRGNTGEGAAELDVLVLPSIIPPEVEA